MIEEPEKGVTTWWLMRSEAVRLVEGLCGHGIGTFRIDATHDSGQEAA